MARWPVLAVVVAAALAPVAHASRGDIYVETDHYAVDDFDAVHLLRIDPQSGAVSTVASSTKLPAYGPPTFVRADGTVLMADLNRGVVVEPSGQVRTLSFSLPGQRSIRGSQPVALGFLASGHAAYGIAGEGVYRAGGSLDGRLRFLPGSRRELLPNGRAGGVVRRLVVRGGAIVSQLQWSSPGARFAYTRFQLYDPRTHRTRLIVDRLPIRTRMQGSVWGALPGGGIVIATGRPQNTVFWVAKPRAGRWAVHRFAPPWKRPPDDGGIAVAGLPGGDIAIVRQTTADNGGFVLDQGIQVLRMAPGGGLRTLYEVAPSADGDRVEGMIAVQS